MQRVGQILMLPLIALDCFVNWLMGQSINKTISGEAWYRRDDPTWSWWCQFIDILFFWQANHCQTQAMREAQFGSVWAAWFYTFKNS